MMQCAFFQLLVAARYTTTTAVAATDAAATALLLYRELMQAGENICNAHMAQVNPRSSCDRRPTSNFPYALYTTFNPPLSILRNVFTPPPPPHPTPHTPQVDEDISGSVDWVEFQLMFRRNIMDKTGLEPSQLFSVVQFLMYDKAFTGFVTLDQTMQMLFSRYGKDRLETELKALFGESITEDGNSKLNFLEYLTRVKERAKVLAAIAAE
jgi:hypothetical protein